MRIRQLLILIAGCIIMTAVTHQTSFASDVDPYDEIRASAFDSSNVTVNAGGEYVPMPRSLNQYLLYKNIVFTDAPYAIEIKSAIGHDLNADNIFEIRIDSMNSEPISTVSCKECADWKNPVINTGTINRKITGVHDVYISTNRPNDFYGFSFLAVRKSDEVFKAYSQAKVFTDIADYKYKNEVETLYGLGFFDSGDNNVFDPERPMTRADFATWTARIYTTDIPQSNQQIFSDVAIADWGFNEINFLYSRGIITENEGDAFRPWDFIHASDAAVMLCRVLGYSLYAENQGGFPDGYIMLAYNLKLFGGLSLNDYVRRGDGAKMIYQAINAKYIEPDTITETGTTYEHKIGIMSETRSIFKDKGIVTANQYGSLVSNVSRQSGKCYIGAEEFDTGETNADAMIGIYCDYYYKYDRKTDTKTIVYIAPALKTKQTILSTDKICFNDISASSISYTENDKAYKIKLKSTVNFIYNSKLIAQSISDLIDADTFRGTMRLIDNGGGYETVVIDHYRNIKISSCDYKKAVIYDELNDEVIDCINMKTYITDGNNNINMKKIRAGSYALIYESANATEEKVIVIEIGAVKKTGVIEEISDDTVIIGGKKFSIAVEINQKLFVGLSADFYVNKFNEIVGYDEKISEKLLGLLSDVKNEDNTIIISLITKTDTPEQFTVRENVYIDGVRINGFNEIMNGYKSFAGLNNVGRFTPVLYKADDKKEIFMLDTILDGEKNERDTLTALNSDNNIPYYYYSGLKAFVNDSSFEMPFPLRANAQVIFVQTENGENYCAMGNYESMIRLCSSHYYPYFYSIERDSDVADIIFIENQTNFKVENQYMLVDKVVPAVNTEGKVGLQIYGYQKSSNVQYWIDSDNTEWYNYAQSLQCGDLIRVTTNIKGELTSFEVGCFHDGAVKNSAGMAPSVHINSGVSGSYSAKNNFVLGKILKIKEGYLGILPFGGTKNYWIKYGGVNINRVKQTEANITYVDVGVVENMLTVGDTVCVWILDQNISQITIYQTNEFTAN